MIHLFQKLNTNFVLDVGSGSIHVLDNSAYYLLGALSEEELGAAVCPKRFTEQDSPYSTDELQDVFEELQALVQQGMLYAEDGYAEYVDALGPAPVKAMCLHVAHDCNLRCQYCFASTGDFGGQRKLMDFDTARKAIDLLISLSGKRRNLEVDFFGGEPLLNFDVVQKTVDYARGMEEKNSKHFRFTITTNGLGLNESNIEIINREMDNVVLSLDGRKPVNDKMRPCANGAGSYDIIVPKIQNLVKKRSDKEYYVRGTYTRDNLDFDQDVWHLSELGFDQISVEPVVGPETDVYSIRPEDLPKIKNSYNRLLNNLCNNGKKNGVKPLNFFHFMLDLQNGPCAIKRLKGCGSGNEYVAVTPDGEIYPCHQFAGNPQFLMGTVDTGITNQKLKKEFAQAHLLNKTACQTCWAKFYCSGGCNANNHAFNGSILEPHELTCKLEKYRLECAIALQYVKALN